MRLTKFGKTIVIALVASLLAVLAIGVFNGTKSQKCETIYNEYTSTIQTDQREILWSMGIENGCFHTN
jgi:hypothetical protein